MSITTVRRFMEKSGCATVVAVVLALVFVIGIFNYGSCGDMTKAPVAEGTGPKPLATAGKVKLTPTSLSNTVGQILQGQMGVKEPPMPLMELVALTQALDTFREQAATDLMLQDAGISLSEEEMVAMQRQLTQEQIQQEIASMLVDPKEGLKATATQAEVEQAFAKRYGNPADIIKTREQKTREELKDPELREMLSRALGALKLQQNLASQVRASDAELKRSYDLLYVKRIVLQKPGSTDASAQARAEEALKAVQGGMSFEQAMNKYSQAGAPKGKTKGERVDKLVYGAIQPIPAFEPVLSLKPGQVSPIIQTTEGPVIYKLIRVQPSPPPDFEKQKEALRTKFQQAQISKRLQAIKSAAEAKVTVKWNSDALKLLNDFDSWLRQPESRKLPAKERNAVLLQFANRAEAMNPTDTIEAKVVNLVLLDALQRNYDIAPKGPERDQLGERLLNAYQRYLQTSESVDVRLLMTKMLADRKQAAAAEQLVLAAQSNNSFEGLGVQRNGGIKTGLKLLQKQNLITPDQVKQVQTELERWQKDKADFDRYNAAQKPPSTVVPVTPGKGGNLEGKVEVGKRKPPVPKERGAGSKPSKK